MLYTVFQNSYWELRNTTHFKAGAEELPPFNFSFSFSSSSSPPTFLLGTEEYHTLSYGPVLGPPFHLPMFPFFLFIASKILTGNRRIPHLEVWARLGSSCSSSYFSFSSFRRLSLLLAPSHTSPACCFFVCCVSASSHFPLGQRPIRVCG